MKQETSKHKIKTSMKTMTINKIEPEARKLYLMINRQSKPYTIRVQKSDLIETMKIFQIDKIKISFEDALAISFKL